MNQDEATRLEQAARGSAGNCPGGRNQRGSLSTVSSSLRESGAASRLVEGVVADSPPALVMGSVAVGTQAPRPAATPLPFEHGDTRQLPLPPSVVSARRAPVAEPSAAAPPAASPTLCQHHYIVAQIVPFVPTVLGVCKWCGATKTFPAHGAPRKGFEGAFNVDNVRRATQPRTFVVYGRRGPE